MAFSIFFSVTVILMVSFLVTKKNLHLFEIIFMWMVIIIIDHMFLTVVTVNLKMFDFGENPANYWTLVQLRVLLFPLLIIWYFNLTSIGNPYTKWAWLPLGISLLVGIEYLADFLHVFKHTRWKYWWSFIEWLVMFLSVYFPWIWFRNLLRKELK